MFSVRENSAILFNDWIELLCSIQFADQPLMLDLMSRIDQDAEYMDGDVKHKLTDLLRTIYLKANPNKKGM